MYKIRIPQPHPHHEPELFLAWGGQDQHKWWLATTHNPNHAAQFESQHEAETEAVKFLQRNPAPIGTTVEAIPC